ncbi:MAG: HD domain-containing protein [candidate division Zixibacteria bacterium]|nr:HD domain-containing protein [candidate division Zixibacteria bacterium]
MTTAASLAESGRAFASEKDQGLVSLLFALYKNIRIVGSDHPTFHDQCRKFVELVDEMAGSTGEIAIKVIDEHLFVNEKLVRQERLGQAVARDVVKEWYGLGIGGVRTRVGTSTDELVHFLSRVTTFTRESLAPGQTALDIEHPGGGNIELLALHESEPDEPEDDRERRQQLRVAARRTFFRAVAAVEDVVVCATKSREMNITRIRRVVHSLADLIEEDFSSLIELTAIRDFDDYTYAHSTNVCVYALALGVTLGMDRPRLSQLGYAALFHDIGKVKLSQDLIRKPDAFDENDWMQIQQHPILGAKTMLRGLKLDTHSVRAARSAFEHHINLNFTGYPQLKYKNNQPGLFSRIISIADTFDAMTSGRIYIKRTIAPDGVLKKMRYQMQPKFDPLLLNVFQDVIGSYPPGTLVLLSTDEIALVLTNNDDCAECPSVQIVGNREGLLAEPEWADLRLTENEQRRIIRRIEPEQYGLDLRQFILND